MSEALHRAEGIAILLWASEPDAPQRLATPFFHAAAAAAMAAGCAQVTPASVPLSASASSSSAKE